MESDSYPLTTGFYFQKLFLGIINVVSSINAKIVALSYYKFEDPEMIICPPVLRKESYIKSKKQEDFVLVYLMNEHMVSQLVDDESLRPNMHHYYTWKVYDESGKDQGSNLYNVQSVYKSGLFERHDNGVKEGYYQWIKK